jgi:hypothetical protein
MLFIFVSLPRAFDAFKGGNIPVDAHLKIPLPSTWLCEALQDERRFVLIAS